MNPTPFNKNSHHVIVDMLNRSLLKNFKPEQVHIEPQTSTSISDNHIYLPSLGAREHWREPQAIRVRIDGTTGALDCWYHRLFLSMELRHAVIEGDPFHTTPEEIVERIQARYNVLLDLDEVEIEVYPDVQPDGAYRCVIKPQAQHLVWSGVLEVRLVASYHIALELPKPELGKLQLLDVPKQPPGSMEYVLLHPYGERLNLSVDWFERCHQVDLSEAQVTILDASHPILKAAQTTLAGYGKVAVKQPRSETVKLRTDVTHWFIIEARWPNGRVIVSDEIWVVIK